MNGYQIIPDINLSTLSIVILVDDAQKGGVTLDKPGIALLIEQLTTWHERMVDPKPTVRQ